MSDLPVILKLNAGDPQPVPAAVCQCPECGGNLWWQVTTDSCLDDLALDCENEPEIDSDEEDFHRFFQSDWQPAIDRVKAWIVENNRRAIRKGLEPYGPERSKILAFLQSWKSQDEFDAEFGGSIRVKMRPGPFPCTMLVLGDSSGYGAKAWWIDVLQHMVSVGDVKQKTVEGSQFYLAEPKTTEVQTATTPREAVREKVRSIWADEIKRYDQSADFFEQNDQAVDPAVTCSPLWGDVTMMDGRQYYRHDIDEDEDSWTEMCDDQEMLRKLGWEMEEPYCEHDCITGFLIRYTKASDR